ncbi:MAG: anthranilate phosphoribosyltransferase [Kiritimatiellae bacterium]|nr:anthranilate phosphoribosyltransferase [Kiritimatiellia bacterium]
MAEFDEILKAVADGRSDLSEEQAQDAFAEIMQGSLPDAKIAALLAILHVKGERASEVLGAARAMRRMAVKIRAPEDAVDIVGTGGDGFGTFNCSTTAAIIAASCGVKIAKHGNRASTSKSGSADMLAALGFDLEKDVQTIERDIEKKGIGFLFANMFHPAMRNVAPVRRSLPFRTVFNLLGPLANPALVRRSALGVYSQDIIPIYVHALKELGTDHSLVFCGPDGLDELGLAGCSTVAEIMPGGEVREYEVDPQRIFGKCRAIDAIRGGTPQENARITRAVLEGGTGCEAYRDAAVLNAAAALVAGDKAESIESGVEICSKAIADGMVAAKLRQFLER